MIIKIKIRIIYIKIVFKIISELIIILYNHHLERDEWQKPRYAYIFNNTNNNHFIYYLYTKM